jgi:hypothetical protein
VRGIPLLNREFSVTIRPGGEERRVFDKPERMVKVQESAHPAMAAWIGVVEHPFFAVTDAAGRFEIKGLSAGKYTLEAWHERCGTVTREIEVKGDAKAEFRLELKK